MILLENVTKRYPGDAEPALDDVSLHIAPNEFVFLIGKSGAGKSTLMKMITKEERPTSGRIVIGGIDLTYVKKRHIPHYRRRLGVVFQDFKLLPDRTVYENVAFALEIAGMGGREIRATVPRVLDLVGLAGKEKKFPRYLAGGEQQRVSIARSIARQPKILIADEPTGNLDKLTKTEIIELLQKINNFGTTILVTTHDENIVNNLKKRVITLEKGRIVSDQKREGQYTLGRTRREIPADPPLPRIVVPRMESVNMERPVASQMKTAERPEMTPRTETVPAKAAPAEKPLARPQRRIAEKPPVKKEYTLTPRQKPTAKQFNPLPELPKQPYERVKKVEKPKTRIRRRVA